MAFNGYKWNLDLAPLDGLRNNLVRKVVRQAMKAAGEIVYHSAEGKAQNVRRYGFLAKSMYFKTKVYKQAVALVVGPRSKYVRIKGKRKRGPKKGQPIRHRPSYSLHLLDRGGKRLRPKPVMKPAFNSAREHYLHRLTDEIRSGIERETAKRK